MENNHRAFTAIELLVGILVSSVIMTAAIVSSGIGNQTPKREAERIQAYLDRVIQTADRIGKNFSINTFSGCISVITTRGGRRHEDKSFTAWDGYEYSDNFSGNSYGELEYSAKKRQFDTGGTITVTNLQGAKYYVIIASTEGRIRISDKP